MGSLFQKNPGQSAASGLGAQLQPIINQIEQYTGQQQQAERGAVAGLGENPYFMAAQAYNPSAYRVDPTMTQTFGSSGPGTYLARLSSINAGEKPPVWDPTKGEIPKMSSGGPGPGKPPGGSPPPYPYPHGGGAGGPGQGGGFGGPPGHEPT